MANDFAVAVRFGRVIKQQLGEAPGRHGDTRLAGHDRRHLSGITDAQRPMAWNFLLATVSVLSRWLLGGDRTMFAAMVESLFAMAQLSVEVLVILFGTLTRWCLTT